MRQKYLYNTTGQKLKILLVMEVSSCLFLK